MDESTRLRNRNGSPSPGTRGIARMRRAMRFLAGRHVGACFYDRLRFGDGKFCWVRGAAQSADVLDQRVGERVGSFIAAIRDRLRRQTSTWQR
eukprot:1186062-Prorocentrum_minimum.AAC.3